VIGDCQLKAISRLISLMMQVKIFLFGPTPFPRRPGQSVEDQGTCFVVPAFTSPLTWFITLIVCSLT
jgi:hypothetical protein